MLMQMTGIAHGLTVEGIGLICWHILDDQGVLRMIEAEGYYLPALRTHLMSPQAYFCKHGGHMLIDGEQCTFQWKNGGTITIRYDWCLLLPIACGFNSAEQAKVVGSVNLCVTDGANQNMSGAQKELLKWLGHMGFAWVQSIACMGILPKHITNVDPPLCASCCFRVGQWNSAGKAIHMELPQEEGGSGNLKMDDCFPRQ